MPMAYGLAAGVGRLDYWRCPAARRAIARGMGQAFPDLLDHPDRQALWLQRHFALLAREVLDVYTMGRLTKGSPQYLMRLDPDALALLRREKAAGRGVVIAMAHFGRVNLLLLALSLAGESLGMLTMPFEDPALDLDDAERRHLRRKVYTLLEFIQGPLITTNDNLRHLHRALEARQTLVMLFDIPFYPDHRLHRSPFLGGTLGVPNGIERLVVRTGAQLLYGRAVERGWQVDVSLEPLPTPGGLAAAVALLERDVKRWPWQWWQWGVFPALWTASGETAVELTALKAPAGEVSGARL